MNVALRMLICEIIDEVAHANGSTWRTKSGKTASKDGSGRVRYHSGPNSKGAAKYYSTTTSAPEQSRPPRSPAMNEVDIKLKIKGLTADGDTEVEKDDEEQVDETTSSGAAGAYSTPNAFVGPAGKKPPKKGVDKDDFKPVKFGEQLVKENDEMIQKVRASIKKLESEYAATKSANRHNRLQAAKLHLKDLEQKKYDSNPTNSVKR